MNDVTLASDLLQASWSIYQELQGANVVKY
jgi:hypothetical protein